MDSSQEAVDAVVDVEEVEEGIQVTDVEEVEEVDDVVEVAQVDQVVDVGEAVLSRPARSPFVWTFSWSNVGGFWKSSDYNQMV